METGTTLSPLLLLLFCEASNPDLLLNISNYVSVHILFNIVY